MKTPRPSVSVVGLGYVGLCTAVTFAKKGFSTLGIDIDSARVEQVAKGRAPIHEPHLEPLLARAVGKGRLRVGTDPAAAAESDVIFVTVGTPSRPDGSIDTTYVRAAAREIGMALRNQEDYRVVVVKSTVVPGTTRSLVKPLLEETSGKKLGLELGLCMNPEFLKEGTAIEDALHPDKLVLGAMDPRAGRHLRQLYERFYRPRMPPVVQTTPETAEMIKYASNAFLATKISYINTIANIAQQVPRVDVEQVAQAIGLDPRIGPLFLKAGPGYGGSCFPKDVKALIAFARGLGYEPALLKAADEVNEQQADRVVELSERLCGSLKDKRVAVLGLAFKKDTDDIREAAALRVIRRLRNKGAHVAAYDPMAMPAARRVLGDGVDFADNPENALASADCAIIMTEWDQFREMPPEVYARTMRSPNIVDARRLYPPEALDGVNLAAIGLGERVRGRGAPAKRPAARAVTR